MVERLVLIISDKDSTEVIERWTFDVHLEERAAPATGTTSSITSTGGAAPADKENAGRKKVKTEKEIHTEIASVIRQITASVSFLPILAENCTSPSILSRTHCHARHL